MHTSALPPHSGLPTAPPQPLPPSSPQRPYTPPLRHGDDQRHASHAATASAFSALARCAKQHSSTVALVPPESVWAPLQQARLNLRDKGLYRWPPHLNLLYPFVPPCDFAAAVCFFNPKMNFS